MNVEKVESLLERSRPAPPPPELRRRIVEAAALKVRSVSVARKPRFVEVMTVAASILMLLGTVTWLLQSTPPAPSPAVEQGHSFEERRLTDALPGLDVSKFSWSADGKHWACVAKIVRGADVVHRAVVDGKPEAEFTEVSWPMLGADGQYAYVGFDPRDGQVLIQNGVRRQEFDAYSCLAWSPNGKKLAFAGLKDGKTTVVVDGKRSEPFDNVWEVVWAPDGRSVAFTAQLGSDWFCVVDGKKGEPFDSVGNLTFSPDGKTFAYGANEGTWQMVLGEEKGDEFDSIGLPVFSADGKTIGYAASLGANRMVVLGPEPRNFIGPSAPCDDAGPPSLSRDGRVWAYRAVPNGQFKEQVRIGRTKGQSGDLQCWEEPGALYDSVSDPVVSPDGARVAYAAGKGSRKYLVVGEKALMKFSLIDRISFGPDGQTVALRAGQYGKQFVVAGKSRSDEFDEVVSGPVWSADGKKVAFTARNEATLWSKVLEVK
jgi:Tol biopolymer transport system component